MMKSKRGWIRIVEAFIAIMLIMAVLMSIYSKQPEKRSNDIDKMMSSILDEIVNENSLRQDIIGNKTEDINLFVSERIPRILNFTVRICKVEDICSLDVYHENVYAQERILSSTIQTYNVTKLKLFVWEE